MLSLKNLFLLAQHPQRYRAYGLQNFLPPSLFSSEEEGVPPHPSCLLREQLAAGDAHISSQSGRLKSSLNDCDDFALTLLGEKSMVSLLHFFNPSVVSLTVFFSDLISFIHAMQFC